MCTYGTPEEAKEISRAESTFKRYIYYTYNILYILYTNAYLISAVILDIHIIRLI